MLRAYFMDLKVSVAIYEQQGRVLGTVVDVERQVYI